MWYVGLVVCTMNCLTQTTYPGHTTFDECLTNLSHYNLKYTGMQITPKIIKRSEPGFHYVSGCFKMEGSQDEVARAAWNKFGPNAYKSDLNIKRMLKRRKYLQ